MDSGDLKKSTIHADELNINILIRIPLMMEIIQAVLTNLSIEFFCCTRKTFIQVSVTISKKAKISVPIANSPNCDGVRSLAKIANLTKVRPRVPHLKPNDQERCLII